MAVPEDSRIEQKELEAITKYKDPQFEVKKTVEKEAKIVAIVISSSLQS